MSEIYLTKIERKTIFTKSLIFVLIMFIISDLTVTGPFWFNFIPWLYILGTVGSVKKVDSVLMCVIGTFTVFVSSVITGGGFTVNAIISTLIALTTIILGIITGRLLFEFVLEHRLVKYMKPSKKTIYIISIVAMFIASFIIVGLNSGNIITYLKSKASLKEYISKTYNIQDFDIVSTKYKGQVTGKYVYVVEVDDQEIYFVPVVNGIFKDANKSQRLDKLNAKLDQETKELTQDILQKYSLLKKASVKYSWDYTEFGVVPNLVILNIECEHDEDSLDMLYEQISNYITEMLAHKQADKVVLKINNESLEITTNNTQKITADYIEAGFQVEEISE